MSKAGPQQAQPKQGGGGSMTKLSYRISSCTSEEPTNRVSELLLQSPQSNGWQSSRFQTFPQEIVVQFLSPVRIRQLQFLSHQYKIASRIEIFVCMPETNSVFANPEFRYRKLGYLTFDSNERSAFQSRELKSVYIESPCLYMKLVFHKQHNNKYNMFNQVGLIALSVFGDVLNVVPNKIEQASMQKATYQQNPYYQSQQQPQQLDNITMDKLRTLEAAKDRAMMSEDIEEVKRLNEAIERLKLVGSKIRVLEERKQIAILNEDYESAKIIKAEVDRLRNGIAPDFLFQKPAPLQFTANVPYTPGQYGGLQQDSASSRDAWGRTKPPGSSARRLDPLVVDDEKMQPREQYFGDQYFDPSDQNSFRNNGGGGTSNSQRQIKLRKGEDLETIGGHGDHPIEEQFDEDTKDEAAADNNNNHDEMVLPAMKNQTTKQPWEQDDAFESKDPSATGGGGSSKIGEPEKLNAEGRKLADPLIPVIGEECAMKLFSKQWQVREEGIRWLENELKNNNCKNLSNSSDPNTLFTAIAGVCNAMLSDKVVQISQASMGLLSTLCKTKQANPTQLKGEASMYIEGCLGSLVELAGHNLPRVREAAEASFLVLGAEQAIGNPMVVHCLSKGNGVKPKILASVKHIVARLNILSAFSKKYQVGSKDVPVHPVLEFATKQVAHANAEIRTAAVALIVEAKKVLGSEQIQPFLAVLTEQQRDLIEKDGVVAAQGSTNGQPRTQSPGKKGAVDDGKSKPARGTKRIKLAGNNNNNNNNNGSGSGQQPHNEEENSKVCEFCNVHNAGFADKNGMDIHLWRECPMLLVCAHCAQVIEIASYAKHLLEDCSDAKKFKACPRCKEPVPLTKYTEHTAQKTCLPAKPIATANRCPLCHTDIEPGVEGWRKHLTGKGCPSNERSAS